MGGTQKKKSSVVQETSVQLVISCYISLLGTSFSLLNEEIKLRNHGAISAAFSG